MFFEVKSSHINGIDYDQHNMSLIVYFKDGSAYNYSPVYENQVLSLVNSESVGKWFYTNIKNNKSIISKKIR